MHYSVEKGVSGLVEWQDLLISRSAKSSLGTVSQVEFINAMEQAIAATGINVRTGNIYYKNNTGQNPGVEILDIRQEHEEYQNLYAPMINDDGIVLHHPKMILFKRLIGTLELIDFQDDEQIGMMAFSISQKGFEVAIGNKVSVCENMCIFGAEDRIQSFGSGEDKLTVAKMIDKISSWADSYESIYKRNVEYMQKLRETPVSREESNIIFGDLYRHSIINNSTKLKIQDKRNIMTLSNNIIGRGHNRFIEETIIRQRESSLWDLYNDITFHHKVENADSINILSENQHLSNYLINYYVK